MAKFQVNILGCGSATPTALRYPSCQVIDFRDRLFMIDCGEGAQQMMRRMGLRFSRLEHIFISHMHGDHCFGLPGLLSTMALQEKGGYLTVHMPAEGLEVMKRFVDYFCREMPYEIRFEPIPAEGGMLLEDKSITVEAFPLYHRLACTGFIFRETPKPRHINGEMVRFYDVPSWAMNGIRDGADWTMPDGRVIENARLTTDPDPVMSYAYCSDTQFDRRVAEAVRGVDTLYHETTYDTSLTEKAHARGHSTAAEAGRIARMAGVNRLIIGHYSKRYTDIDLLYREAQAEFDTVVAAAEGLKIDLL